MEEESLLNDIVARASEFVGTQNDGLNARKLTSDSQQVIEQKTYYEVRFIKTTHNVNIRLSSCKFQREREKSQCKFFRFLRYGSMSRG
jgi:hypothetical protein